MGKAKKTANSVWKELAWIIKSETGREVENTTELRTLLRECTASGVREPAPVSGTAGTYLSALSERTEHDFGMRLRDEEELMDILGDYEGLRKTHAASMEKFEVGHAVTFVRGIYDEIVPVCPICGGRVNHTYRHCPKCGAKLNWERRLCGRD